MYLGEKKIQESMPLRLADTDRYRVPDGHLRLTERFFCLEGEGLLMGTPCFLIRFSGCNLRCTWCDSKHSSWHDHVFTVSSVEEVFADLVKVPGWVSYTGGEPLWRQENELRAFARLIGLVQVMRRPQEPRPPFPYTEEQVEIVTPSGHALAGTLTLPPGPGR